MQTSVPLSPRRESTPPPPTLQSFPSFPRIVSTPELPSTRGGRPVWLTIPEPVKIPFSVIPLQAGGFTSFTPIVRVLRPALLGGTAVDAAGTTLRRQIKGRIDSVAGGVDSEVTP